MDVKRFGFVQKPLDAMGEQGQGFRSFRAGIVAPVHLSMVSDAEFR